jgi:hypothetical protein
MSVVMTVLSVTASKVALRRVGEETLGEPREDVDDMADVALLKGFWPGWL